MREQEKNYSLQEQINSCVITTEAAQKKMEQLNEIIDKKVKDKLESIKEEICNKIQNTKGNISKNQVCKIIKED